MNRAIALALFYWKIILIRLDNVRNDRLRNRCWNKVRDVLSLKQRWTTIFPRNIAWRHRLGIMLLWLFIFIPVFCIVTWVGPALLREVVERVQVNLKMPRYFFFYFLIRYKKGDYLLWNIKKWIACIITWKPLIPARWSTFEHWTYPNTKNGEHGSDHSDRCDAHSDQWL